MENCKLQLRAAGNLFVVEGTECERIDCWVVVDACEAVQIEFVDESILSLRCRTTGRIDNSDDEAG